MHCAYVDMCRHGLGYFFALIDKIATCNDLCHYILYLNFLRAHTGCLWHVGHFIQ